MQVPACFVPQPESEQEFGYRVISGPENTEFGQRWYLQRINQFAIYDENIEFLTFDVEYRDNHLLRFKVKVLPVVHQLNHVSLLFIHYESKLFVIKISRLVREVLCKKI